MNARAFYRQRPLVCVACAAGLGVWLTGVARPPAAALWAGLLSAIALTAVLCWAQRPAVWGACAAACFVFALYALPAAHPVLPPEGKYEISGRVSGVAERRDEDGRVQALLRQVTMTDAAGMRYSSPAAYWTYYPGDQAALPLDGQTAAFTGQVYHPAPQQNPFGFDFRQYLLTRGVPVGISGARELALTPSGQTAPADGWLRLRMAIGQRLDSVLGTAAPVARALLTGDRTALSDETSRVFRDGGIAHVLAVSGLHVGLLMAGVLFLLRRLHVRPWLQLACAAVLLLIYCRLLDFSAPVVRASILTIVLLLGRALRRPVDPLTSLACAFLLVLALRPMDLFSIGFQLSFLAVAGIVLLGDRLLCMARRLRCGRLVRGIARAYAVTLSATAFTAIPTMAAFHRLPLAGLLLGPLACAAVGGLLYLYTAVLALTCVWLPAAHTLAAAAIWLTGLFQAAIAQAAAMPRMLLLTPAPPVYVAAAVYLAGLLATRYVRFRRWHGAVLGGAALVAALGVALLSADTAPRYTQLSAGDADCAVIEDGAATYVIDTGSHGGDLAGYLLSRGRGIDALFISHLHSDHLGGLQQLMEQRVPIGRILVAPAAGEAGDVDWGIRLLDQARAAGIPVHNVHAGDTLQSGRVRMEVLWPHADAYPGQAANRSSMVTCWDIGGLSVLSMGDLDGDYEQYAIRPAQVLKAAHHGGRSSTGPDMIARVRPQLAIITSSGTRAERSLAVEERLRGAGCRVLNTWQTGAITLRMTSNGPELQQYLAREGK